MSRKGRSAFAQWRLKSLMPCFAHVRRHCSFERFGRSGMFLNQPGVPAQGGPGAKVRIGMAQGMVHSSAISTWGCPSAQASKWKSPRERIRAVSITNCMHLPNASSVVRR